MAFSLDNVVAVVAVAPNSFWLVMVGVAIGILTMRFAASIFTRLIKREPILKSIAYILVLNAGVELLLQEILGINISDLATFFISIGTLILSIVYTHFTPLHFLRPAFRWFSQVMAHANVLYEGALKMFLWLIQRVFLLSQIVACKTNAVIRSRVPSASAEIGSLDSGEE